jgi:probable HAF family extracellular repeat protein
LLRSCILIIGLGVWAADLQASPVLTNLGLLPGARISRGSSISGDGSVVAGGCYYPDGHTRAFRWTSSGGMQDLGVLPGDLGAYGLGVSGDGSTVVGQSVAADGNDHAFRWTSGGGMQDLGFLPGATWADACGTSGDGSAAVGSYCTSDGFLRGYLWTSAGGMQDLGVWPGGYNSSADAISGDGSTVAGSSGAGVNHTIAFRWTSSGGMEDLGALSEEPFWFSAATATNRDGSVVAGCSYVDNGDNTASCRAFRWTADGGMQNLGILPGQIGSWANAISGDGSVLAGACTVDGWSIHRPFLWTAALGMVDLNGYFASLGVDLAGWTLVDAKGLSADGSAMTGWGIYNGEQRAWLVSGLPVPEPATAALLGLAVLCAFRLRRK